MYPLKCGAGPNVVSEEAVVQMYRWRSVLHIFVLVPSANKRDLRSIEQTLNDMKSRKKPKLDSELSSEREDPPSE